MNWSGVTAIHQVVLLTVPVMLRTLPSARPACMAWCGVEATRRSHSPPWAAAAKGNFGWIWNFENAP